MMPDREKVINGLETIKQFFGYGLPSTAEMFDSYYGILNDAIAMLKKQEAVEPKTEPSAKGYWYTCGACGWWLFEVRDTVHFDDRKRIHFCASCGQAVKWE